MAGLDDGIRALGRFAGRLLQGPGVSRKLFQSWRRRHGLTAGVAAGKPGGFVEIAAAPGLGWDVELALGDGVVLRLLRS